MSIQVKRRRGTSAENNNFTGAQGELTIDTTLNTIRVHDGSTRGGFVVPTRSQQQATTTPGTYAKVTVDSFGFVTGGATLVESDIPTLSAYVPRRSPITASTKAKISYDANGLVTGGTDLSVSDIPTITISKVNNLQEELNKKQPFIPVERLTTTVGSVTPRDNAINYVEMTGTLSINTPTVSSESVIHQFVVQLKKNDASWVVNLGTTKYFGGTMPTITAVGLYNIYYEYDYNLKDWVVGAIYKGAL